MFVRVKDSVPHSLLLEVITRFDEFVDKAKVIEGLMLEYTEHTENRLLHFITDKEYNAIVMIRIETEDGEHDYFIELELDDSEKLDILAKIVKTYFDCDFGRGVKA